MAASVLPGVFGLIKGACSSFKRHYKVFISIGLMYAVLLVVENILSEAFMPNYLNASSIIISIVFVVINLVAVFIINLAYIKAVHGFESGAMPEEGIKGLLRSSSKLFWSKLWISILMFFVIYGIIIIFMIAAVLISACLSVVIGNATPLMLGICFMLLLISFIVAVYLFLAEYLLVVDGTKGLDALAASFYYVKGNFRKVFWRFFGLFLILALITAILIAIVLLVLHLNHFVWPANTQEFQKWILTVRNFESGWSVSLRVLVGVAQSFVLFCIFYPLLTFYFYRVFRFLKLAKSQPVPETDFRKSRGWLTGLAITGLVFGILGIFAVGAMSVISKLKYDSSLTPASVSFDTTKEPSVLAVQNPAALESKPYVNKDLGFSIQPPKGWSAIPIKESISFANPSENDNNRTAVTNVAYVESLTLSNDETAAKSALVEILKIMPRKLQNVVFSKTYIGSRLAYMTTGNIKDSAGATTYTYYFVTNEVGLYLISIISWDNATLATQTAILDSAATFKTLK